MRLCTGTLCTVHYVQYIMNKVENIPNCLLRGRMISA